MERQANDFEKDRAREYRKKAVGSHDQNAPLFADRYEIYARDPYASAFTYGRKKLFERIFFLLEKNVPTDGEVLDVGCGTGYFLTLLGKFGYRTVGLEPAAAMRERAQSANPGREIADGEISRLPFADNRFDAVTAIEVFRYLHRRDIINGYRECLRVLKPGGVLIASLVNKYALDGFIFKYLLRLGREKFLDRPAINYCDFTTPRSVAKLFTREFGQSVETYSALLAPLRLAFIVNRNLGRSLARALEPLDEWLNKKKWHQPLAGHLLAVVKKFEQVQR